MQTGSTYQTLTHPLFSRADDSADRLNWTRILPGEQNIEKKKKIRKRNISFLTYIHSLSEDWWEKGNYVEGKSEFNFEIVYHTYEFIGAQ